MKCSTLEKLFCPDKKNTPARQDIGISIKTVAVDEIQIFESIHLILKVLRAPISHARVQSCSLVQYFDGQRIPA